LKAQEEALLSIFENLAEEIENIPEDTSYLESEFKILEDSMDLCDRESTSIRMTEEKYHKAFSL